MASSLLFPVVSTSHPNLLDIAMRMLPLMRACRFSSATLGWVSSNTPSRVLSKAEKGSSIGIFHKDIPRLFVTRTESSTLPLEEYREGMVTATTFSGPNASTAMVAVRLESIPPESPRTTFSNPFLRT